MGLAVSPADLRTGARTPGQILDEAYQSPLLNKEALRAAAKAVRLTAAPPGLPSTTCYERLRRTAGPLSRRTGGGLSSTLLAPRCPNGGAWGRAGVPAMRDRWPRGPTPNSAHCLEDTMDRYQKANRMYESASQEAADRDVQARQSRRTRRRTGPRSQRIHQALSRHHQELSA